MLCCAVLHCKLVGRCCTQIAVIRQGRWSLQQVFGLLSLIYIQPAAAAVYTTLLVCGTDDSISCRATPAYCWQIIIGVMRTLLKKHPHPFYIAGNIPAFVETVLCSGYDAAQTHHRYQGSTKQQIAKQAKTITKSIGSTKFVSPHCYVHHAVIWCDTCKTDCQVEFGST